MNLTTGAHYMIGSALSFSVMSVCVKAAGQRLPVPEIVLARALISLFLTYGLLLRSGRSPWGKRPGLLLLRGVFGFLALSCFYYAVTHLPLAEVTVIQYLFPIFTALLAALFLGERAGWRLVISIAFSLGGLALVTKPPFLFSSAPSGLAPGAVLIALGGALLSAAAYVVVRHLSRTEHALVIVFYFPLVAVPASLPAVLPVAIWPTAWEWLLLLGVGLSTQFAQIAMTRGLTLQPAGRATAISYLQVLFATTWGVLFFGERPDVLTFLGAGLILGGTLTAAWRRA